MMIPLKDETPTPEIEEAFASLLRSIDQNTHQLVIDISSKDYLAMLQLLFRIPGPGWSLTLTIFIRLGIGILSRASLLPLLGACLLPGSVLAAFLKKLAQIISNIVFPQNAEVPPPFLENRILATGFWHAHLKYACRQATPFQKSQERRLAGNQLCYWTSADADHCMKVTQDVPKMGLQSLQGHIGGSFPVPTIAEARGCHPWVAIEVRPSFMTLFALP